MKKLLLICCSLTVFAFGLEAFAGVKCCKNDVICGTPTQTAAGLRCPAPPCSSVFTVDVCKGKDGSCCSQVTANSGVDCSVYNSLKKECTYALPGAAALCKWNTSCDYKDGKCCKKKPNGVSYDCASLEPLGKDRCNAVNQQKSCAWSSANECNPGSDGTCCLRLETTGSNNCAQYDTDLTKCTATNKCKIKDSCKGTDGTCCVRMKKYFTPTTWVYLNPNAKCGNHDSASSIDSCVTTPGCKLASNECWCTKKTFTWVNSAAGAYCCQKINPPAAP